MKACKHGHVDGVRHIPCPKCQLEYWQGLAQEKDETIESLYKEIHKLNDKIKRLSKKK